VSPVSIDFINPESPWPALDELRERTERAGYRLRERLCAYPELVSDRPDLYAPEMLRRLRAASDGDGYARPLSTGARA
jgi:FO synthase